MVEHRLQAKFESNSLDKLSNSDKIISLLLIVEWPRAVSMAANKLVSNSVGLLQQRPVIITD